MGGDGGSIPGRADMIKTKGMKFARNLGGMGYNPNLMVRADTEKYTKSEERQLKWRNCAISQTTLKRPLVACRLGRIYNKDAIIEAMLKKTIPEGSRHIRSLKDIRTLCPSSVVSTADGDCLVCPISKDGFDGSLRGFFGWRCGCVISEKALKNLKRHDDVSDKCLVCGNDAVGNTLIPLIPDNEQQRVLEDRLMHDSVAKTTGVRKRRGAAGCIVGGAGGAVGDNVKNDGDNVKNDGDNVKNGGDRGKRDGENVENCGDSGKNDGDNVKNDGDPGNCCKRLKLVVG